MKLNNCIAHGVRLTALLIFVTLAHSGKSAVSLGEIELLGEPDFEDTTGSRAHGVSDDGTTIFGTSSMMGWIWRAGEWTLMGDLPGGNEGSEALAVSADGSVVVGYTQVDDPFSTWDTDEAFRWEDGVMVGLGFLPGHNRSYALGISADGSVVVGSSSSDDGWEAVRWEGGTMAGLGFLPGHERSEATGISADGSIIIGFSEKSDPVEHRLVLWRDGIIMDLGVPPGYSDDDWFSAAAVSADGSTILINFESRASYIWQDGIFTRLEPANYDVEAWDISADGSLIVGMLDDTIIFWDRRSGYEPTLSSVIYNVLIELHMSANRTALVGTFEDEDRFYVGHAFRIPIIDDTPKWAGYTIINTAGDVDTSPWLGWINAATPWIYVYDLNNWMYCPEENVSDTGAWVYVTK